MTKTLTEKWREGKLPENTYYVQFICGRYGIYEFEQFKGFGFDNDLAYIKEVLAPVPSYEEWHKAKDLGLYPDYADHIEKWEDCARLTKQLAIATKALKYIRAFKGWQRYDCERCANNALKEIKEAK